VIGNDSSYKAYTKDQSYLISQSERTQSLEEAVLRVTLKNYDSVGQKDLSREQYRVSRSSELTFNIQFSGFQKSKGSAERNIKDIRRLISALQKLYPGCYIPLVTKNFASIDLP
jgi:hypothetical protein